MIARNLSRTLDNTYADAVFGADSLNFWNAARNGHWLLFVAGVIQILMILTMVPLKASFIQLSADDSGWIVTVLPTVGYILLIIYGMLLFFSVVIVVRLWHRETGLRWDPRLPR